MTTAPRVLVDATAIPADRAGVGRYVDELLRALDAAGEPIAIACQARDEAHYRATCPGAVVLPVPGIERAAKRFFWEQFGLPRLAKRAGVQLIHSPHYTLPLATRRKRTVAFHDATFWSDPGVHTRAKRRFFPAWMRLSRRRADAIIVPSAATAGELARYLGGTTHYDVIHHGVDHERFRPPGENAIARVREAHGLAGRWIAFLGNIEPRKNLLALVEGYSIAAAAWRGAPEAFPELAIAGANGWDVDLTPAIARVPAPGRARQLGFLPLDDLAPFLGGAELVCYPSLAEGFGLPVLEALACGAPVLTTRRLAIPEVAGDVAAYTEPDAASIAAALLDLLEDPERRAELARRGPARAAEFTWSACALAHLGVWDRVLGTDAASRAERSGAGGSNAPLPERGSQDRVEGPTP